MRVPRPLFLFSSLFAAGIAMIVGSAFDSRGFDVARPLSVETHLPEARQQNADARRWLPTDAEALFRVGGGDGSDRNLLDDTLLKVSTLKVGPDGHVFIVDGGEWLLKEFSPDGVLRTRYGHGFGQGPGEFQSLTDFDVSDPDEVWISDGHGGRVTVFSREGEIERTLKLTTPPYRLVRTADDTFTLLAITGGGGLFRRHQSDDGSSLGTLPEFFVAPEVDLLALTGFIAPDGAGGFVYVSRYAGILARYDAEGSLAYVIHTIDRGDFPKIVTASNGDRWIDREEYPKAQSLQVINGKIMILAPVERGFELVAALDVYDLETGRYLYSLDPPQKVKHAAIYEDYLYIVDDTSLAKWRFELPQ